MIIPPLLWVHENTKSRHMTTSCRTDYY